jgi:hypothetical protein
MIERGEQLIDQRNRATLQPHRLSTLNTIAYNGMRPAERAVQRRRDRGDDAGANNGAD